MIRILRGMRADAKPLMISISDKERRLFDFIEKTGEQRSRIFQHWSIFQIEGQQGYLFDWSEQVY